uniref:Uncharacterized protein n=1 Tax=Anguilla anguilla TaxID=7936 RepID=A0A0E9RRW8_ANGAN
MSVLRRLHVISLTVILGFFLVFIRHLSCSCLPWRTFTVYTPLVSFFFKTY